VSFAVSRGIAKVEKRDQQAKPWVSSEVREERGEEEKKRRREEAEKKGMEGPGRSEKSDI
jgi:hypothetical protein